MTIPDPLYEVKLTKIATPNFYIDFATFKIRARNAIAALKMLDAPLTSENSMFDDLDSYVITITCLDHLGDKNAPKS